MTELLIAFIGLAATLIGSGAAFYAGRLKEKRDAQREEYGRFINVLSDLAYTPTNSKAYAELWTTFFEQKAKIILYCSPSVFEALLAHAKSTNIEDLNRNYCRVIAAMRADMGGKNIPNFEAGIKAIMLDEQKLEEHRQ